MFMHVNCSHSGISSHEYRDLMHYYACIYVAFAVQTMRLNTFIVEVNEQQTVNLVMWVTHVLLVNILPVIVCLLSVFD